VENYLYACLGCYRPVTANRATPGELHFMHAGAHDCPSTSAGRVLGWTLRGAPVFPTIPATVWRYDVHPGSWKGYDHDRGGGWGGSAARDREMREEFRPVEMYRPRPRYTVSR
jgi:hypothetical protein